jgi:hypothetical protein
MGNPVQPPQVSSASASEKKCYRCGKANPADQAFCGACGSPLALADYISMTVKTQLDETVRDRDVLEMDSSIKVFKRAWDWIKLIFGIAVGLLVLTGAGVIWKASDFWTGVDKAKQSVTDTAKKRSEEIANASSQSKQDISKAVDAAKSDITRASSETVGQSKSMKATVLQSKAEISKETTSFRTDLEGSRQQLQAATKLQPEIETLRKQLEQANNDIQKQQKVISSSEDFVKSVFASHRVEIFLINQAPNNRYVVLPPTTTNANTVVYLLLAETPISNTIQLQYHVFAQQPNTYFQVVHNLLIFFWGEPPGNLMNKQLSVSYFPDRTDKDLIHSLSLRDGRCYADEEPLLKFNQSDTEFKGNKWMPLTANPAKP